MPTKRHEDLVEEWIVKGFDRNKFAKKLKEYFDLDYCYMMPRPYQMPDAFRFSDQLVEIVEVYVTHPPSLNKYRDLWFYLDCEGIDMKIKVVDRFGAESEIDPVDNYYTELEELSGK